jgi:hypothetical protein
MVKGPTLAGGRVPEGCKQGCWCHGAIAKKRKSRRAPDYGAARQATKMLLHISPAILRPVSAYCLRGEIMQEARPGICRKANHCRQAARKEDRSMTVKRIAKCVAGILVVCSAAVLVGGCTAVAIAGTVVGAGVSVASAAVDVGVTVASTAVSATTGVVKAVVP